uniref:Uncharacterized protein n=1 Tax=Arundo donax TaxID=35708 RepID=A0A0A9C3B0_ARUDO
MPHPHPNPPPRCFCRHATCSLHDPTMCFWRSVLNLGLISNSFCH